MNHIFRSVLFAATVCSAAIAGSPGCADSESMIFVRQVNLRVPGQAGQGCTVDDTPTALTITAGTLDVAFRTQYIAPLLVGNQMVPRANGKQLKTETSRVQLQGAEVRVEDRTGAVLSTYTVPGSGFIDPATGDSPSFGLMDTVLIDSATGSAIANQLGGTKKEDRTVRRLTTHVIVFGKTLGGLDVRSGEWSFPINVCYGCLVTFPVDAIDTTPGRTTPNCGNTTGQGATIVTPCDFGQDAALDCRLCHQAISSAADAKDLCEPL